MKMKNIIIPILCSLVLMTGCSGGKTNPYSNKEYDKLEVTDNFQNDYSTLYSDLSENISNFTQLVKDNSDNLSNGKTIADIDAFNTPYDKMYEFCYKIDNLDESKIPDEYKESFKYSKEVATTLKKMLDECYNADFEKDDPTSKYISDLTANLNKTTESLPKKTLNYGGTYDFNGVTLTLSDKPEYSKELRSKNDGAYYYAADDGNLYLSARCEITNDMTKTWDCDELMGFRIVYDGQYEYTPILIVEKGRSFSANESIDPLETLKGYISVKVPEKVKDMNYQLFLTCNDVEYEVK